MANLRVVLREREVDLSMVDLDLGDLSTDSDIITAVTKHTGENLANHMVRREGENILVSPTPVFG